MFQQITKSDKTVEHGVGYRVTVTELRLFGWLRLYKHTRTDRV